MEERVIETATILRLKAKKASRNLLTENMFSLDTIQSNAEILAEYGGQTALVFRAIAGSYRTSKAVEQNGIFKMKSEFRKATGIPPRQFSRAVSNLEEGGYIECERQAGTKVRYRMTEKGKGCMAKVKP